MSTKFELLNWYKIGDKFGHLEIIAYKQLDGKFLLETDPNIGPLGDFYSDNNFERIYKVYCHNCGTTKTVEHSNLQRTKSCGCVHATSNKNFNWSGKSRKLKSYEQA